eukprot:TRINITY_DN9208_c0_g1_i1.p1 TRINITY_DN9208_c0_g1~~TRINITY_DN9208_c0_g1_i1.p1  ORF type:complete len:640 (-),score=143.63 TRINITY_DN9208_c0_g1_i1:18-1754(-)
MTVNCIDRHLDRRGDQVAIIWEGDEPGTNRRITYRELHQDVCRLANALKQVGVTKGDTVAIYMPMVPEAAISMLACARIGAVHSVTFAGFSAESLRDRIRDCGAKVLLTADEGVRGGRKIALKKTADAAVAQCPSIHTVFVHRRTGGGDISMSSKDVWMHEAMERQRPFCPAVPVDSEDPLFMLYTSGSTGAPKGVLHTTGGYAVFAATTFKYVFDYREGDIFCCVADIGWITGHTYVLYGPLLNGATTVLFESLPTYPDAGRYWDMVDRLGVSIFYTAPTAIRTLMRSGPEIVKKYQRSSLRILGSVGEPINPEAWRWYNEVVGDGQCAVVDTYWQTETGGIVCAPLPGMIPTKPGSATLPFFGVEFVIKDAQTGATLHGNDVEGALCIARPWPGMARTVYNNHARYLQAYMEQYQGFYFTGDGCKRDADGYLWITGRIDDVLNVAGHRIGTAEVESALVAHRACAEAAVVGEPHEIKGQAIFAYVTLKDGFEENETLLAELRNSVRHHIGPIATPEHICITPALPKTRSGKIMRRILRKIVAHETDSIGDTSTLADPSVVDALIAKVEKLLRPTKL